MVYDATKPLDLRHVRRDIHYLGIPLTEMCLREYTDSRQRQLFKNVIYVGALAALLNIDFLDPQGSCQRAVQGQREADHPEYSGAGNGSSVCVYPL